MKTYLDMVAEHYCDFWSEPASELRWSAGPIQAVRPEFRVLVVRRSPDCVAFATLGMSSHTDADSLEIHILAKPDGASQQDSVAELLATVAHYHCTERPLGLGHTVNFGRPWLPESACCYGLLSLPYLDGPKLEWMGAPRVRFLWLIPITHSEREFKKTNGTEALEQRFERESVDVIDPFRPSVV